MRVSDQTLIEPTLLAAAQICSHLPRKSGLSEYAPTMLAPMTDWSCAPLQEPSAQHQPDTTSAAPHTYFTPAPMAGWQCALLQEPPPDGSPRRRAGLPPQQPLTLTHTCPYD